MRASDETDELEDLILETISLVEEDDDLEMLDDFKSSSQKKHSQIKEIDLEELIELEARSKGDYSDSRRPVSSKPKKKIPYFSFFYIFVLIVCGFISIRFLLNVDTALGLLKKRQPEVYLAELANSFTSEQIISEYLVFPQITYSPFDDRNKLSKDTFEYILTSSITFERTPDFSFTNPAYTMLANGNVIGNLTLDYTKNNDLLGVFTNYNYSCSEIQITPNIEPTNYTITALSTDTVSVNDIVLKEDSIVHTQDLPEMETFKDFTEVPSIVTYQINQLIFTPDVSSSDFNGKTRHITSSGTSYTVDTTFQATEFTAKQLLECNLLQFIENYSSYLSLDLKGKQNGFSVLSPYLLKDSPFYEECKNLITKDYKKEIVAHTLPESCYNQENIVTFIPYTENFFFCEVSLVKSIQYKNTDEPENITELYDCYFIKNPDSESDILWNVLSVEKKE